MVDPVSDPPRKRQRMKESLPHFVTEAPKASQALGRWNATLAAILAEANPFRVSASISGGRKDQKEGKLLTRVSMMLLRVPMPWGPPTIFTCSEHCCFIQCCLTRAVQTVYFARALHAGIIEEPETGPPAEELIQSLQKLLVADEDAAEAIMPAIACLSYEQLQTVQVHHTLLADL